MILILKKMMTDNCISSVIPVVISTKRIYSFCLKTSFADMCLIVPVVILRPKNTVFTYFFFLFLFSSLMMRKFSLRVPRVWSTFLHWWDYKRKCKQFLTGMLILFAKTIFHLYFCSNWWQFVNSALRKYHEKLFTFSCQLLLAETSF